MNTVKLTSGYVPAFREYFNKYAVEQDVSYPPLDNYLPSDDEPAYILLDDNGGIAGAAALMLQKEYRDAKTGRFRIFHCIDKEHDNYKLLLDKILPHASGLDDIYCFVDEINTETRNVWESIGFRVKRFSWVLEREADNYITPSFPEGYELKQLVKGRDEQAWCDIINESFANMLGHVHMHPYKFDQLRGEPGHLEEGLKLLWHNDKPVGTISLVKEDDNGEDMIFIEAVSLLNSYQGKGLGKNLIRAGIDFAKNFGVKKVMLCVNAENELAAELYFKEGFQKEAFIMCYSLKL